MGAKLGGIRRFAAAAVVAVAVAALAGCVSEERTRPVPDDPAPPVAVAVMPLTGRIAAPDAVAHPSIAAKIDNHEAARPQLALNRSDIAFEELVEGGLTRYLVVWHSDVPEEIGPVRSIRPMDPDIVSPFGGMIAYSGGQPQFVEMIQDAPVVNLAFDTDTSGLFHRSDDREAPHNVILDAAAAVEAHADLEPPPIQFRYGSTDPLAAKRLGATPTSRIDVTFSNARFPSWEWDASAGVWLRSQEGAPDAEASGDRVRAVNVVTLRVEVEAGEVPRTVLVGSGEAWVSAGGRTAHGTWEKDDRDARITLTADDGRSLPLAPGNTWVELVPDSGDVAFSG